MKTLKQYIIEQDVHTKWLENVKKMYKWYCDNFDTFYDYDHYRSTDNCKKCELIDNKLVRGDCSGFVGACLCLSNYTDDPLKWNASLGSFNMKGHKRPNIKIGPKTEKYRETLKYICDIDSWKHVTLKDKNDLSEVQAGDILTKGTHCTIVADNGAKHLYDWGEDTALKKDKTCEPVDFYIPHDKNGKTFLFVDYWRLK